LQALVGEMSFAMARPDGGTFTTCLNELAMARGLSLDRAARALDELDGAGLLTWDAGAQVARLQAPHSGLSADPA
jgi:hypothetical protein